MAFDIQARDNGANTFDIRGMSGIAYLEELSETLTLTDLVTAVPSVIFEPIEVGQLSDADALQVASENNVMIADSASIDRSDVMIAGSVREDDVV